MKSATINAASNTAVSQCGWGKRGRFVQITRCGRSTGGCSVLACADPPRVVGSGVHCRSAAFSRLGTVGMCSRIAPVVAPSAPRIGCGSGAGQPHFSAPCCGAPADPHQRQSVFHQQRRTMCQDSEATISIALKRRAASMRHTCCT